MKKTIDRVYELEMFEQITVGQIDSGRELIRRVPGGWLYSICVNGAYNRALTTTFIPYVQKDTL